LTRTPLNKESRSRRVGRAYVLDLLDFVLTRSPGDQGMAEGLENPIGRPPAPKRRRCRMWSMLLALMIVALAVGIWISAPDYDPRLIGEWQDKNGIVRVFHPDGRTDVLEAASGQHAFPAGRGSGRCRETS
jgi:hypothetical protein